MKKITKKSLYYFCILIEQSVAYYLTYKWSLILFASLIAFFPTITIWWSIRLIFNWSAQWELIFFIMWLVVMIIFFVEFREFPYAFHISSSFPYYYFFVQKYFFLALSKKKVFDLPNKNLYLLKIL